MKTMLTGTLIKGATAADKQIQAATIIVERIVSGGEVKLSYVNLRGYGRVAEMLVEESNGSSDGIVQVLGNLDVEQIDGLDVPVLSVENVKIMPNGTPHSSLVFGIGNVVRDAEIRVLNEQWRVMTTSLASNRKERGEMKTSFFTISMFGKVQPDGKCRVNNLVEYVTKGKGLSVSGQLDVQLWNDRDDNTKQHSAINIIIDSMDFLPSAQKQEQAKGVVPPYVQTPAGAESAIPSYVGKTGQQNLPEITISEDEIPF